MVIGFAVKWFDLNYAEKVEYLEDLKKQLSECKVNIDIEMEQTQDEKYKTLVATFEKLQKSKKIWDMVSSVKNDATRSSASDSIKREETSITHKKIPFLNADYNAMCFENKNGSDVYIYPGFAALFDDNKNFGLVELKELNIEYSDMNFLEEEKIPADSVTVGETWAKVNKNGTPDKRFKGNYKIPIVKYGELKFTSNTGIREVFVFSNVESSKECELKVRYV